MYDRGKKYTPGALRIGLYLLLSGLIAACGPGVLAGTAPTPPLPTAAVILNTAEPTAAPTNAPTATQIPTALPNPSATPVPQPWRFVVLGDTRTSGLKPPDVTYQIVERAAQAQPAIVLAVGDLINALDSQYQVREQWRNWR